MASSGRPWTAEEDAILARNPNKTCGQLAKLLTDRSDKAIEARKRFLRDPEMVRKEHRDYHASSSPAANDHKPWTQQEDDIILASNRQPDIVLAKRLKRSSGAITTRRARLLGRRND